MTIETNQAVFDKIAKLLAMAQNRGASENEAQIAAAHVQHARLGAHAMTSPLSPADAVRLKWIMELEVPDCRIVGTENIELLRQIIIDQQAELARLRAPTDDAMEQAEATVLYWEIYGHTQSPSRCVEPERTYLVQSIAAAITAAEARARQAERERYRIREGETKERTHQRYYEAFHTWFMSDDSSCDFWSECDAPESLASIAVEMQDEYAAAQRQAGVREGIKMAVQYLDEQQLAPTDFDAAKARALMPAAPEEEQQE